jgi:hypothetical protein
MGFGKSVRHASTAATASAAVAALPFIFYSHFGDFFELISCVC